MIPPSTAVPRVAALFVAGALFALGRPAHAQTCAELRLDGDPRVGLHGDPDLRCLELVPSPGAVGRATGRVELLRVPGPFTVSVTPDGEHVWRLRVRLDALPEPAAFADDARAYVAWVTTPVLRPFLRLGPVRLGEQVVGDVALDKFIVLISAEASDTVSERRGPLVLRGTSPSMRLQPDHMPLFLSEAARGARERAGLGADADHAHHPGAEPAAAAADGWPHPAMPTDVVMLPGMMPRLPNVAPFRPAEPERTAPPPPDVRTEGPVVAPVRTPADGATIELSAERAWRTVGGAGWGFDGIDYTPGPTLRVRQGATLNVRFRNRTELPLTVHWHGLRLENRFDGVPGVTQRAVAPGESFDYRLVFPDAGTYWYHPHERSDIAQDLGLYGNILVDPVSADAPNPVHHEVPLMLDDVLTAADGRTAMPHGREAATHALMGRFGDVLLVNGRTDWSMEVARGAVVRFLLTNTANTRTFNVGFGVDSVRLVGGDVGSYAREAWVRGVPIGPAERYAVEVRYDRPGTYALTNRVRAIDHVMGAFVPRADTIGLVRVSERAAGPLPAGDAHAAGRAALRAYDATATEIDAFLAEHGERAVDRTLLLRMEADSLPFPLDRLMRLDSAYFHPVEWAGTMPDMNWILSSAEVRWILEDAETGARNHDIDWDFALGSAARIRIVNVRGALHAMQHPIHLHGQRFLILEQDGVRNEDLVWKDTILLPVGSWADILVDFSNPGRWMLHCHIAEHMEAGMHTVVDVR